jgi:GNAT superfamily N-acetyltransferase
MLCPPRRAALARRFERPVRASQTSLPSKLSWAGNLKPSGGVLHPNLPQATILNALAKEILSGSNEANPMQEEYRVVLASEPEDSAMTVIGHGIRDFNKDHAGENNYRRLCVFLHAPDHAVVGGLIGSTYWNWFYVDLLWVVDELRGRGYGHQLLTLAEHEARQRGAKHVYLDTFSFQAPNFYRQHGYEVFGELHDFPEGHMRYFLTKQL